MHGDCNGACNLAIGIPELSDLRTYGWELGFWIMPYIPDISSMNKYHGFGKPFAKFRDHPSTLQLTRFP
jgi:hypothetical protein